jgi:hypothetical protein
LYQIYGAAIQKCRKVNSSKQIGEKNPSLKYHKIGDDFSLSFPPPHNISHPKQNIG